MLYVEYDLILISGKSILTGKIWWLTMREIFMKKPWIAIVWFGIWGIFQAYAVCAVLCGNWEKPEAFPEQAYKALIYPDMVFIPLYFTSSVLLLYQHYLGYTFGLMSCGAVVYVMIYLLSLSDLKGEANLVFDSIFLIVNIIAMVQITVKLKSVYGKK